jgi:hypothetical protein
MIDPIGHAFARVALPEPGIDFDRQVVARLEPLRAARLRAARRVMILYWGAALVMSVATVVNMNGSPTQFLLGGAALMGLVACSLLAAGGGRNLARALLATYRGTSS